MGERGSGGTRVTLCTVNHGMRASRVWGLIVGLTKCQGVLVESGTGKSKLESNWKYDT